MPHKGQDTKSWRRHFALQLLQGQIWKRQNYEEVSTWLRPGSVDVRVGGGGGSQAHSSTLTGCSMWLVVGYSSHGWGSHRGLISASSASAQRPACLPACVITLLCMAGVTLQLQENIIHRIKGSLTGAIVRDILRCWEVKLSWWTSSDGRMLYSWFWCLQGCIFFPQ